MEILFRGKPDIDQEWLDEMEITLDEHMENLVSVNYKDGFVFGQLVYSGKQPYIVGEVVESTDEWITLEYWIPVKPETVGQYTGLKDKGGVKIFEGDLFQDEYDIAYAIKYCPEGGKYVGYSLREGEIGLEDVIDANMELIGNIHDNPELLEVE